MLPNLSLRHEIGGQMARTSSLHSSVALVQRLWLAEARAGAISSATAKDYTRELAAFRGFAETLGIHSLDSIDTELCRMWIAAPIRTTSRGSRSEDKNRPSTSTRRRRQTSLRRAVHFWLKKGLIAASPISDEVIRGHITQGSLPLTPPEVSQLRLSGRVGTRDNLRPAMVEAALAGASQQSIALLMMTSFDVTLGVLHIPGSRQTGERDLQLGPVGVAAMQARVTDLTRSTSRSRQAFDPASTPLLLSRGPGASRSANPSQVVASNLKRALAAAGVNRTGVTAGSLQAFAANACYARTHRVEEVAARLGLHSLDRAMTKVDHQWQAAWADHVRALDDR